MTDSRLQPGEYVWYASEGLGRVQEAGDRPAVVFWADRKSGKAQNMPPMLLTPLANYLPEAERWGQDDSWKKFESGVKKAPLTMVALALESCGGSGEVSDIRERLDKRTPLGAWNTWWKRTEPKLGKLTGHFGIDGNGKGVVFTLHSSVAQVPPDWKATLDDWKRWLLSEADELPPEPYPADKIAVGAALADWPEHSIEQALSQALDGANLLLDSPRKPAAAAALAWIDAVGSAALRLTTLDSNGHRLVERSGETLLELSQHIKVKARRKEVTLFWVGALTEGPDRKRQLAQQREHQRADYEVRLEQQRQEQEGQLADYQALLDQQRQERARQQSDHTEELKALQQSLDDALKREQEKDDRIQKLLEIVSTYEALMKSGRKESRLEVRQGMLRAVGDSLQRAYIQGTSAEDRLDNVIASLPNVLQEGGAEILGTVGATVKYDSRLHHSPKAIPSGAKVRLAAPGVIVGERVILKASVSNETEVC